MKLKKKMGGFVQTAELVLLSTVLVTGLTVGMANLRDAVNEELEDVAESVGALDQSYSFYGVQASSGSDVNFTVGSSWTDGPDSFPAGDQVTITYDATIANAEAGS
ncbi:MAG: hypothetical protein KUL87_04500 [Pseudomonas sp.]|nr:hypothetical protein [Pseudomonas sp.]